MSLNIKDKDAHKLSQQLARLTGESLTEAVTEALRERLKRVQNKVRNNDKQAAKLSDRLLEIGRDCSKRLKEPFRSADHGDLLYDEKGLPK
jgi:antitoxin VapB